MILRSITDVGKVQTLISSGPSSVPKVGSNTLTTLPCSYYRKSSNIHHIIIAYMVSCRVSIPPPPNGMVLKPRF